MSYNVKFKI